MTALVLGATGFVGREVTRQLGVRGDKPVAHVRPESAGRWRGKLMELGAHEVDATPWEAHALGKSIARIKPSEIYILIGTTRGRAKADSIEGDIYEKVDLGLTIIAVEAAQASNTKPRLVYLSGIGADASARGAYMRARGKAEDAVRGSGLPWVIARPAIITGDRDDARLGESMGAIVGDGVLAVAGLLGGKKLRDRYKSTTPDVLAAALIRIGSGPEHDRAFDGADLR